MTEQRPLQQVLNIKPITITNRWFEAIAPVIFVPSNSSEVRQFLAGLTEQILDTLLADQFDATQAQAIGDAMAQMHMIQSGVLGSTLEVLTNLILESLDEDSLDLQRRLAALLNHFSIGFIKRSRKIILAEQEEIRSAYMSAHKQLEMAVRQSEEKYRTLVESADQAIFVIDKDGVISFLNRIAASLLGRHPREITGQKVWDLLPEFEANRLKEDIVSVLESGISRKVEAETVKSNRKQWRETVLQPLKNSDGEYDSILGISSDITARKHSEESLRQYSERLRILREIDRGILAAQSPEAIGKNSLALIKYLIPYRGALLVLLHLEKNEFTVLSGQIGSITAGMSFPLTRPEILNTLKRGETLLIGNIHQFEDLSGAWKLLQDDGAVALLGVPIRFQQELIGVITLVADVPDFFRPGDIDLVRDLAASLAIAFQNARLLEAERAAKKENQRLLERIQHHAQELEQRVEERTQELTALYYVTAVANEHFDLQTVLDKSLERTLTSLRCSAGVFHLLREDGKGLEVAASLGISSEAAAQLSVLTVSNDLINRVTKSGQPLVITDLINDIHPKPAGKDSYLQGLVSVPMRARGHVVGLLTVFGTPEPGLRAEDLALLSTIADHVGGAVENAKLYHKSEQMAVVEERERLARELHDSVSQALYSLTLFAEAAHDRVHDGRVDLVEQHLEDIGSTAHQALREMRLMLYELRTSSLLEEGLVEALRRRLDAVETRTGMQARFQTDSLDQLPEPLETGLHRIVQEALNNVLKHADATKVTVVIRNKTDHLSLQVTDNGNGFNVEDVRDEGGMGLQIMQERAEKIGGVLEIWSKPGQGTRIQAQIKIPSIIRAEW